MLKALADAGYQRPTPIQAQAVPLALKGRDIIGLAMTGTGKTAAFVIPIIERLLGGPHRTRALILTPTRELCVQVEESFRKYGKHSGLGVIPVYGGVGYEPQVKALRAGVDVVVATPGRLLDHLEKQNVVLDEIEVLVLDEADRMLDMGFAPQINRIVAQLHSYRQTLLFSATMPPEVEALARKYLRKPVVVQVGRRSGAATTVQHFVYPCPKDKKTSLLVELLKKESLDSVLVFTRTKHGADRVVKALEKAGINAGAMHADKTQGQRTKALDDFKTGEAARARRDRHRAARARHLGNLARHQLRRSPAGRGLRAPHRPHGPRRGHRRRVHVHVRRRDRDGEVDRADRSGSRFREFPSRGTISGPEAEARQTADGRPKTEDRRLRTGVRRSAHQAARTRPSRDITIVSDRAPRLDDHGRVRRAPAEPAGRERDRFARCREPDAPPAQHVAFEQRLAAAHHAHAAGARVRDERRVRAPPGRRRPRRGDARAPRPASRPRR